MFRLISSWVWDFWFADDGEQFHLFFLKAPRALIDPDRRHSHASIGHATSIDLRAWVEQVDALVPSDGDAFDDLATWTGSIVRDESAQWRMFYSGISRESNGLVQRIGSAVSDDLYTWTRANLNKVLGPNPEYYESLAQGEWPDEAWRDPWVFRDRAGLGWHMLITARAREGNPDERGVVGHAWSPDLITWNVLPPLSATNSGFGQLEVLQLAEVDDRLVLVFSCMTSQLSTERQARGESGGIWVVNVDEATGPFDISTAYRLTGEELYVGRLIQQRTHEWSLLAFRNLGSDGQFVGEIVDPLPVRWIGEKLAISVTSDSGSGSQLFGANPLG